jgi:hypothetical protein
VFAELDRERRRIEAALHDGVQQDLAAAAVGLQLAVRALDAGDPAGARELLAGLETDVEAALERVRALAQTIYPSGLPARGLAGALAGRVEVGPVGRYQPAVEEAVYFACLALLTETTRARVWEEGGAVRVEVSGAVDAAAVAHARARLAPVGGQVTLPPGGEGAAASVPVSSAR